MAETRRKRRSSPFRNVAGSLGTPYRAGVIQPLERRTSGLLRVPFVRRCVLSFDDGSRCESFLVNINVLGAYVAQDPLPRLGQAVSCRFAVPGCELEVAVDAVVAWINPHQQHPVHSLPPGFGLKFKDMSEVDRRRIEDVIEEYIRRHPPR